MNYAVLFPETVEELTLLEARQRLAIYPDRVRFMGLLKTALPPAGPCLFAIRVLAERLGLFTLFKRILNHTAMTDNDDNQERRHQEQQDLERQQQDLFSELDREQLEAEQALEQDQEGSVAANSPDKIG